jgi:hypothetical protein
MNFVALRMLTEDRGTYLGLIFTIAFASFLMTHQASILPGSGSARAARSMTLAPRDSLLFRPARVSWRSGYPQVCSHLWKLQNICGLFGKGFERLLIMAPKEFSRLREFRTVRIGGSPNR